MKRIEMAMLLRRETDIDKAEKETIIEDYCPIDFGIKDKTGCQSAEKEKCKACWETEFISDEQLIQTINNYLSKQEHTSDRVKECVVCNPTMNEESKATRKSTLDKAKVCVLSDREGDYGSPEDNFRQIAEYWMVYLAERHPGIYIRPEDVAVMMTLMKIARTQTGKFKEDNFIDGCGYLACASEISYNSYIANKA